MWFISTQEHINTQRNTQSKYLLHPSSLRNIKKQSKVASTWTAMAFSSLSLIGSYDDILPPTVTKKLFTSAFWSFLSNLVIDPLTHLSLASASFSSRKKHSHRKLQKTSNDKAQRKASVNTTFITFLFHHTGRRRLFFKRFYGYDANNACELSLKDWHFFLHICPCLTCVWH